MKIEHLQFSNFRNLKEGDFFPVDGVNVIFGKNAQGKTNLLEAMWLFTGGRSFRGAKDADLVAFGQQIGKLHLKFFSGEREQSAEILLQKGKRNVVLNGVEQRSASGLIGKFCAVIFSPEHLSLIKDGPSLRRNFMDAAICQIKPLYARTLYQYNRILVQRNALLKDIPRHSELLDTLEIWDEKLARYGGEIAAQRIEYITAIQQNVCEIYSGISKNKEKVEIHYQSPVFDVNDKNYTSSFFEILKKSRKEDLSFGFTTAGPHRDDLDILIDSVSARSFGSQGQQRSVVLSLKLAESQFLGKITGETPIVFLDDVMSELDAERQDYLLNHLENRQVFITCCEPDTIKRMDNGGRFQMVDGTLIVN